nr:putative ribonuclease h protein [Quercus suber]
MKLKAIPLRKASVCDDILSWDDIINVHCFVPKSYWIGVGIDGSDTEFFTSPCSSLLKVNSCKETPMPNKPFLWNSFFLFSIPNLWLQRNRYRFQNLHIIYSLIRDVEFLASEFSCLVSNQETASLKIDIIVRWEFPTQNWFKLNSIGSALGCPGLARGGGLIRDHQGRWVKGYTRFIGWANRIEAEFWAVRDGLILCLQLQVQVVELSLMLNL